MPEPSETITIGKELKDLAIKNYTEYLIAKCRTEANYGRICYLVGACLHRDIVAVLEKEGLWCMPWAGKSADHENLVMVEKIYWV